jgi:hypothetical protein
MFNDKVEIGKEDDGCGANSKDESNLQSQVERWIRNTNSIEAERECSRDCEQRVEDRKELSISFFHFLKITS